MATIFGMDLPAEIFHEIIRFQGPHPISQLFVNAWNLKPFPYYCRYHFWYHHLRILEVEGGYSGSEQIKSDYGEFLDEYDVFYSETDDEY